MKLYGNKHVPRPEAEVFLYKPFRSVRALTQSSLIYTAQHSLDPPSEMSDQRLNIMKPSLII